MKSYAIKNGVRPTITTTQEGSIGLVYSDKGAIFYNTDTDSLRTWDGTTFNDAGGDVSMFIPKQGGTFTNEDGTTFANDVITLVPTYTKDFEDGTLDGWLFKGTSDWTITTTDPASGTYCAQSGVITHSQATTMYKVHTFTDGLSYIKFKAKVSAEGVPYDTLQMFVDGISYWVPDSSDEEIPWTDVFLYIPSGEHEIAFTFSMDGTDGGGTNQAWVDDIEIGEAIPNQIFMGLTKMQRVVTTQDAYFGGNNYIQDVYFGGNNHGFKHIGNIMIDDITAGTGGGPSSDAGNVVFGSLGAGGSIDGAYEQTFFGHGSGASVITGFQNAFFGFISGYEVTTGSENSLFGAYVGRRLTTGGRNCFFGAEAGSYIEETNDNVMMGFWSGRPNIGSDVSAFSVVDTNMTFIGSYTGRAEGIFSDNTNVLTNSTAVGYQARITKSNQLVLGDENVTEVVMGNGDIVYPSTAVKPGDNTEFTGVVSNEIGSLIPSANVLWTGDSSNLIRLILSQDSILDNPSAPIVGAIYQIIVEQDATGLWTLGYGTMFKFPDGVAPVIDLNPNSKGILTALYDGTDLLVVSVQNFL